MDLSQLSTPDLKALQAGNMGAISDAGLQAIAGLAATAKGAPAAAPERSWGDTANATGQNLAQGATFGFADEIGHGIAEAAGPVGYGAGRAVNALANFAGVGNPNPPDYATYMKNLEGNKAAVMAPMTSFNQDHPWIGGAEQAGGAILSGGALAKLAESMAPESANVVANFAKTNPYKAAAGTGAVSGAVYGAGTGEGGIESRGKNALLNMAVGAVAGPVLTGIGRNVVAPLANKAAGALEKYFKASGEVPPGAAGEAPAAPPALEPPAVSDITNEPLGAVAAPEAVGPATMTGKLPLSPGVKAKDSNLLRIEEEARQGGLGNEAQGQIKASDSALYQDARRAVQQLKGVTNKDSDAILSDSVQQFQKAGNSVKASAQALYKKRDALMADAVVNRKMAAKTVGKDMFKTLTDPSNIAGFKSKSGDAAKQLYSDFRDLMRGTADSATGEGVVTTGLPAGHPDALYTKESILTSGPTPYKNPILKWIADKGGVKIGSDLDSHLRSLGIAPGKKETPVGLFKKDVLGGKVAGKAEIDNIPVGEFNDQFDTHFTGGEDGYVKPEEIVEAIRNEQFGKKLGAEYEAQAGAAKDQQAKDIKDEVFDYATKTMGEKNLTNSDVEKIARAYADGKDLHDSIAGHMQEKYFSETPTESTKKFSAKEALPFNDLAAWRQDAAHLALTDESTSGHLAKKLIQTYEDWLDNIDQGQFISGSKDVATAAREAGSAWKNYKTLFGSENSPIIEGMTKPYDMKPADFVDSVFGKNIEGTAKTALNMRKMTAALPEEAQKEFKENVFKGLVSRVFEGSGNADELSLKNLRNNLTKLQGSQIYKEFYAQDKEKSVVITNLIKDLSQHLTQTSRRDVVAPSGGYIMRGLQKLIAGGAHIPVAGKPFKVADTLINKGGEMAQASTDRATFNRAMKDMAKQARAAAKEGKVFDFDSLKLGVAGGVGVGDVVQQKKEKKP